MNPETEAHLRSLVNFPSPPGVATHIIELARDPEIELSQVAKALSMDSALSTKILRIANSPLYAQRRKSESLRQALIVLGLNATLTLALSFSLVKFLRDGTGNGVDFPLYWRRALLAAIAARALCDVMHQPHAEEVFLAALLQDVGILALDKAVPDLYAGARSLQSDHVALAELETRRLQVDHAHVGGWLMRIWNLPERLHRAITNSHHAELGFTADPAQIFDRCVAQSGPIADLFVRDPGHRQFAETALTAERSLGLDKMAFGQILSTVGSMIPETEALFDADRLCDQHPELVLEQAHEVLMLRSVRALREINTARAMVESSDAGAAEVEEATRRDPLTGVYNRAYLDQALEREFDKSTRHKWPLSVAIANLEDFKRINDELGRQAGDRILQSTARLLRANTREADLVARCKGEEFIIVLPATDAETAHMVCERIVAAFQNAEHSSGSNPMKIAISIGFATHFATAPFSNTADLIKAADQALQTAKASGRNRTIPFDRRVPTAFSARPA